MLLKHHSHTVVSGTQSETGYSSMLLDCEVLVCVKTCMAHEMFSVCVPGQGNLKIYPLPCDDACSLVNLIWPDCCKRVHASFLANCHFV